MTWRATTEDGLIVVTDGDRRLEAFTTEPHLSVIGGLIAYGLAALDAAEGDPSHVHICRSSSRPIADILSDAADVMAETTSYFVQHGYAVEGLTALINKGWQIVPPLPPGRPT